MLRVSYVIIIFLLAVACTQEGIPDKWNEQEAVYLLADLHIIQSSLKQVKRDSIDYKEAEQVNYLLNKYDLKQEELNRIVNYVQSDEKRAAVIYEKVVIHLDSIFKENEEIFKKKK